MNSFEGLGKLCFPKLKPFNTGTVMKYTEEMKLYVLIFVIVFVIVALVKLEMVL